MKSLLLDTGPLIAYLVGTEPAHLPVAEFLDDFSGQLHTTSAVITEAMHFVSTGRLGGAAQGPASLAEFVSASAMRVHDFSHGPRLHQAAHLMNRYADTPMDHADATLVLLAEELELLDILTLDRRGFSAYRTHSRKALRWVEL